jgi:hypothetical protein
MGERHAGVASDGPRLTGQIADGALVVGDAGADQLALRQRDLAAPVGGLDREQAGRAEHDVIELTLRTRVDVAPDRERDAELRDRRHRGLLRQGVGEDVPDLGRRGADESLVVRIVERDASTDPLAHELEIAFAVGAAGVPVHASARLGVGARRLARRRGPGRRGRRPGRPGGVGGRWPSSIVRGPRLGSADLLPRELERAERRRGAAEVGVGLAGEAPVRAPEVVVGRGRGDAEDLVRGRGGGAGRHDDEDTGVGLNVGRAVSAWWASRSGRSGRPARRASAAAGGGPPDGARA